MTMFKHATLATVLMATIGLTACQTTQGIDGEIPLEVQPIQITEQAPPAMEAPAVETPAVVEEGKSRFAKLKDKFNEMKSDVESEVEQIDEDRSTRCTQRNPGQFQHYGDCQFQRIKNMESQQQ